MGIAAESESSEVAECPCGGEHQFRWHQKRGIPICRKAQLRKNEQQQRYRDGIPVWTPGTPILVEEIEEL